MATRDFKKVTKKAVHEAKVSQLDTIGTDIESFLEQGSLSVVENILGEFIERVHANINNEPDFVTTGQINEIEMKQEGTSVNVYAFPHLLYQDRGVNGSEKKLYDTVHSYTDKRPPVYVFKNWIKTNNIQLRDNEKFEGKASPFKELDEDSKINSAAWGMSTKIFKEGFKPRKVYSKEIPQLIQDLSTQIAGFTAQSIIQFIDVKPEAKQVII